MYGRIICSAIYVDDEIQHVHQPKNIKTGFVVCGRRHHNCLEIIKLIGKTNYTTTKIQGFLTENDYFVNRAQAFVIAKIKGQIIPERQLKRKHGLFYELLSEDLY